MNELRHLALVWLCETNAETKVKGVLTLKDKNLSIDTSHLVLNQWPCGLQACTGMPDSSGMRQTIPGRPIKPELVAPLILPKRSMRTLEGRVAIFMRWLT